MEGTTKPELPDLGGILARHIKSERSNRPRKGKIYPSDLGVALGPDIDGCPLLLWLKLHDEPMKELGAGQLLLFKAGDMMHELVADMLKKALPDHGWEVVEVEGWVRHLGLNGRMDVKIRHVETGYTVIIDVKTKRGSAFRFLNEPKMGDELQVQFYIAGEGVDEGRLLYVDREGQNFMREFPVERADDRPEEAVRRLEELRDGPRPDPLEPKVTIKENKGPDSVYLKAPWQVQWCHAETCPCEQHLKDTYGGFPDGIVAKISNDGELYANKPQFESWMPLVFKLIREQHPKLNVWMPEEVEA